ncbi:hypothetical protein R80B4_01953 [Fibrobacteres bacterium R8-0-B4]
MITLHEAYLKAKSDAEEDGHTLLDTCNDYGDFWGFLFLPPTFFDDPPNKRPRGFSDVTVNKKTGEIGYFVPHMDFDLFDKRISIPIEQFTEYNVAV